LGDGAAAIFYAYDHGLVTPWYSAEG